jgi:hypothetical protein
MIFQILALFLFILSLIPSLLVGQTDSTQKTNFVQAFSKGKITGSFRLASMVTDNMQYSDYYAAGAHFRLKFETKSLKGFQIGTSLEAATNLISSDFLVLDKKTGASSRYEASLFDIQNPTNKYDLTRIEELYITYKFKKINFLFGRQRLNSPYINLQDGRLNVTSTEGAWFNYEGSKIQILAGWIYAISPRSTYKWFTVGSSIGVYNLGQNPNGTNSNYRKNLESKGIGVVSLKYNIKPNLKITCWEYYVENIFNTAFLQIDYEKKIGQKRALTFAGQITRQDPINYGGNSQVDKSYFGATNHATILSGSAGFKTPKTTLNLNYTRITNEGRYLMPREWGRDPFFTFMPRERNEGLGNVNAITIQTKYNISSKTILDLSYGQYFLPEANNYKLNKYAFPSYNQVNIMIDHQFSGHLNGLNLRLLYVYKGKIGNDFGNDKFVFNKVNLYFWNVIVNYVF